MGYKSTMDSRYSDERILGIIPGLLELKRRGVLSEIWVDSFRLRVRWPGTNVVRSMLWYRAERLIAQHLGTPPHPAFRKTLARGRREMEGKI